MRLAEAVESRQDLERQLAGGEGALRSAGKAIADRREALSKLAGNVNAARARTEGVAEEIERLAAAHTDALMRAEAAQAEVDAVAAESTEADRDKVELDARHDDAVAAHDRPAAVVRELSDAERAAEKDAASWKAREEALAMGLRRKDGAGALLARADQVPGLLGSLASLLTVRPGHEAALAAALGGLADAVAPSGIDEAVEALRSLKIAAAGRADLLVGAQAGPGMRGSLDALRPSLPAGAVWGPDVVDCPESVRPAV